MSFSGSLPMHSLNIIYALNAYGLEATERAAYAF